MADDKKKSKIDLKARLGKTTTMVGGTAPAVPLPVPGPSSSGGSAPPAADSNPAQPSSPGTSTPVPAPSARPPAPMGIAPPPGLSAGLSPGIPLPPFAQARRAEPAAPKPSAAQQTIKVEIGEEIIQERKKAAQRAALYAVLAAIVGGVIGFVAGGSQEKGSRVKDAAKGAGLLEKDVKAAVEKMKELDEKLVDANTKLGNKTFPDDLVAALGGINVPFDATNLDGKGVGSLPSKTLRNVLAFTSGATDVNKSKDSIKNILGAAQAPIVKAWKEEKDPVFNFSVTFSGGGGRPVTAELVTNKEPFSIKGDLPKEYSITKLENGKPADKKWKRYDKGDLPGGDSQLIPIDPKSTAGFTNEVLIQRLNKAIFDLRQDLEGNKEDPTRETNGLIKDGDDLTQELHKASLNQ